MTNPNDTVEALVAECARAIERMTFPVSSADHVARAIIPLVAEACARIADSIESPFDEHFHAPENCAFHQGVEALEMAIRQQLASSGQEKRG
jgi:hypothetical protein